MADPHSEVSLGVLLTLAVTAFKDAMHADLDRLGYPDVRPAFGALFKAVREQPITLTELADRIGVTKQAAAKLVDEGVAKDLVHRTDSPVDGRAKLLTLTDRGRAAMDTAMRLGDEIEHRLRDESGPDLAAARRALTTLIRQTGGADDLARRRVRSLG
jgi:DNA-binding MarR family transcriptional regulator